MRSYPASSPKLFIKKSKRQPDWELVIFIQEQIEENLLIVVNQVIQTRIDYFLNKRKPQTTKAKNFISVLKLFHCEQYSMGEIAALINFTNQYQVSRLVKLKELKQDVSRIK